MTLLEDLTEVARGARSVSALYSGALELLCRSDGWPVGRICILATDPSEDDSAPPQRDLIDCIWGGDAEDRPDRCGSPDDRHSLTPGIDVVERVLRDRSAVRIEDVTEDPDYRKSEADSDGGFRAGAILAVPVIASSGVRAVLELYDRRPRPVEGKTVHRTEHFAFQLGWLAELREREASPPDRPRLVERIVDTLQAIGSPRDAETVMQVTADKARALLGTSSAAVYLTAEDDPDVLVMHGVSGNSEPYKGTRYSIYETLMGHAFRLGEVLVSNNTVADPRIDPDLVRRTGLRAIISVPLKTHQEDDVIGLLNLMSNEPDVFHEEDLHLIRLLSTHMASALERAWAFESNERLLRELSRTASTLEETLNEREALLDASLHAIIALDEELQVTVWSRAAEEIYGWEEDEVLHRPLPILPDYRRDEALRYIGRVLEGESIRHLDVAHLRKDGSTVEVRLSASPAQSASGERSIVLVVMDMTEVRRFEARLQEAERMESVGRLAAGIAHDFNNMLMAIKGHAELLQTVELAEEDRESVREILDSVQRASSITKQLLAYSRKQHMEARPISPSSAIREMSSLLDRLLDERVDLVMDLDPAARPVLMDPAQFDQIMMNLVLNARDAMPDGGEIRITSAPSGPPPPVDSDPVDSEGASHVRIAVSDQGEGMSEEIRNRIFEPFFSTKGPDKGTGLGLATVHGVVHQSGGALRVESAVGEGSTFHVFLPAAELDRGDASSGQGKDASGSPTILLVEEMEMVGRVIRRILEPTGFELRTASDTEEAIRELAEAEPDILVTDAAASVEGFAAFLDDVRRDHPDLPVLVITDEPERTGRNVGASAWGPARRQAKVATLRKPFSPDTLRNKVTELLEWTRSDPARAPSASEPAP